MRLPSLVDHYSEHKATTGNLTFINFLYIHYIVDDQNPKDDEQEKQLPFKSHAQFLLAAGVPAAAHTDFQLFVSGPVQKPTHGNDDGPLSFFRAVILQPPRL